MCKNYKIITFCFENHLRAHVLFSASQSKCDSWLVSVHNYILVNNVLRSIDMQILQKSTRCALGWIAFALDLNIK